MKIFSLKNWINKFISASPFLLMARPASATTTGALPFNATMDLLKDAISGPFLLAAAIILIVVTCLMLAFGEWGDGFKKLINIVLWLSIAFSASNFISTMFGSGVVLKNIIVQRPACMHTCHSLKQACLFIKAKGAWYDA